MFSLLEQFNPILHEVFIFKNLLFFYFNYQSFLIYFFVLLFILLLSNLC